MNYTELVAAIQSYTENQFPTTYLADGSGVNSTTQINTFIKQAEQRIYNSIQFPSLRKNVTGTTTSGNKYLSCPSDFLSVYSLAVIDGTGAYEYLLNKDVNFIRQSYPSPTATGKPRYYALFGSVTGNLTNLTFIVGPTPDSNYSAELHYFYYPASIVTNGTSWLGDNFDSVLLYGSLLEAYTFMKGEADVIAGYQKRYDEALAMLKELGEGKNRQDMYRTPQVRYPVR